MLNNPSMALPPAEDRRGQTINTIYMKQSTTPKKLQLTKIKVANLSTTKQKNKICVTSADQTTCPAGCKLTNDCI